MIIEQKLKDIQNRAAEIEAQMNSGEVSGDTLTRLSKEYSRLGEILPLISEYFQTVAGIADAKEMQSKLKEIRTYANRICGDMTRHLEKSLKPQTQEAR